MTVLTLTAGWGAYVYYASFWDVSQVEMLGKDAAVVDLMVDIMHETEEGDGGHTSQGLYVIIEFDAPIPMNVDLVVEGMQTYGRPVEFSEDRTKARFVADVFMNAHDQYSGPMRLTFQGMTVEQMAQMSQGYWLEPRDIAVNDSMFQYDMSGNPVSSPSMGHSVTVADSDGGTLTVDKEEAEEGNSSLLKQFRRMAGC